MLTEGWDANNVTHVLGIRAFGTQLLCEQVIGRALRRQSYEQNDEGLFDVEYADVFGVPFAFPAKRIEQLKSYRRQSTAQLVCKAPARIRRLGTSSVRRMEGRISVVGGRVRASLKRSPALDGFSSVSPPRLHATSK